MIFCTVSAQKLYAQWAQQFDAPEKTAWVTCKINKRV